METFVVESIVRTTLLGIACAIVLWAARVKTPATLHAAWTGVVLAMLILPAWRLWGPEARIPVLPQHARAALMTPPAPLSADAPSTPSPGALTAVSGPATHAVAVPPEVSRWRVGALAVHGVVALILLARLASGTIRARTLVKRSSSGPGHLISAACAAPVTVGWLRPVIILPETWRSWPTRKLDAVLIHEREHARRRHPFVQWLALLNRALFWFHPFAWWLPRHLSTLAEQTCDDAVLAQGHDPRDYSRYLVETASGIGQYGRVRLAGVFMPGHQVTQRIQRILAGGPTPAVSRPRGIVIATACALVCVVMIVATPVRATQTTDGTRLVIRPVQPRVLAPERPQPVSLEWLDGDEWAFEVQPIASPDELTAYSRLANARERNAFIERFWALRDPSQGTAANDFRDEYQRRIAFARKNFETSSGTGFDTDRGRMHLMFGAPDSIERESTSLDRFEIWHYGSIPGLGSDVRIRFSLSRDSYCGLRLVSPAPPQRRSVVGMYPLGLTAIAIPVDAKTAVGVRYELRTRAGESIDEGQIGFMDAAAADGPLAGHVPQEWFAGGFGCTHALPPNGYRLTTAVRRLNGELVRDSVTFEVE